LQRLFASPYVQNGILTGEMTPENKRFCRSFWKKNKEVIPTRVEMLKQAQTLLTAEPECETLDKIVNGILASRKPFLDNIKGQCMADQADDIRLNALNKVALEYHLFVYREMKRGDLVRMILTDFVPIWHIMELRTYVKRHPKYRSTPLAQSLLYMDFDLQPMFDFYKHIIDSRTANLPEPEKQELIDLTKESTEINIRYILMPIEESILASPCINKTINALPQRS